LAKTGAKTVAKNLTKKNSKIKVCILIAGLFAYIRICLIFQTHNVSCPVASADHAGYMPKRYEFETEWDNDAEFMIADVVFYDTDDEALTGK